MNRRAIAIAVAGISVAGSVGTALALPSRATAKSGAFSFLAVEIASHNFKNGHFVFADKDISGGRFIGTDTLFCVPATKSTVTCHVTASYKAGQIYGKFTQNVKTGALSGKVTGGTGHYRGAVGTITGTAASNNNENVHVTYQTP